MLSNYIFGTLCAILLIEGHFAASNNDRNTDINNERQRCPFLSKRAAGQSTSDQNAGDAQCSPRSKRCDQNDIYYSMDGSCNNLKIPSWGQAGTAFVRLMPANYSDGISQLRKSVDGNALPLARTLRQNLLQDENIPSKRLNIWFYGFGQFLDHDVTLARQINSSERCCVNNQPAANMRNDICLPMIVTKDDSFYRQFGVTCLEFKRMINSQTQRCNVQPVFQINWQTALMDLSVTYGTSDADIRILRTGKGGQLRVTNDQSTNNQEYPHIISGTQCPNGGVDRRAGGNCFMAGDERINQNPELLLVDVVFLKFHNLIAKGLQSVNPRWNDDRLFKETRRISIAMYQHIISAEYLPVLIGPKIASLYKLLPLSSGYASGYNQDLNPQTLESYSSAAGRGGHSNVVGTLRYTGPNGRPESYRLRDKFFNNSFLLGKNMYNNILQAYLGQPASRQDQFFTQEINNWMFHALNEQFGFDLSSVDIMRGRDFGLQPYNKFREACGLCKLTRFEDLANEIRRPEDVKTLKSLYKSVDDIDFYIGGLLEKPLPDGTVGQSFACIQAESFYRWKFGDRLFYEFPTAKFTPGQLNSIRQTSTMSGIICSTNPWMKYIQRNAFLMESAQNPRMQCSEFPMIDLEQWRER